MSFRYPAGLITASSPVNANYPSGVWTPRQALPYLQNNVWGQDPFFDQTVLLLHGDGTNGAQNNTFLDSSSNNFTITRNGNTTQGTFTPFSLAAGEWSNYFIGTGQQLLAPAGSAFAYGTGQFTVEAWIYPISYQPGSFPGANFYAQTVSGDNYLVCQLNGSGQLSFIYGSGSGTAITTSTVVPLNTWTHVAIVREGTGTNQFKLYINGVQQGIGTVSFNFSNTTYQPSVGNYSHSTGLVQNPFNGYISNIRVVKGRAVYTSNFTPSTVPLGITSGGSDPPQGTETSLLTCQNNRFVDATGKTITTTGSPRVTPFSPFAPTAAYSAGTNGGSGYFDGTGDYLNTPSNSVFNPSGQDITVDFWVYMTSYPSTANCIFEVGTGAVNDMQCLVINTGELRFQIGNVVGSVKTGFQLNRWHYVTCVKSGTNFTVYLDAVAGTTVSLSPNSKTQLFIGATGGGTIPMQGYISNFRYIQGSATAPTSVPTAPLTAISNTSLLLNFTNAGILDNTAKNVLETVGNAQIETSVVKYGTGAMEFDGTGDYLLMNGGENFAFGTGNFTVEGWLYFTTVSADSTVYDSRPASTNGAYVLIDLPAATGKLRFYANSAARIESNSALVANTWYYFAVVRSSSVTKMYINGVEQTTTYSDTTNYLNPANRPVIGVGGFSLAGAMNGYIDDLRVTKGIARYTANFVPPVARFPNQ